MKYLWCVIFSLFLVTKPLFPLVEYATNYDYIATVLCVNKAKPESHCNGKCHLMQELAKASDTEKAADTNAKKGFSFGDYWFSEARISLKTIKAVRISSVYPEPVVAQIASAPAKILRPPISA